MKVINLTFSLILLIATGLAGPAVAGGYHHSHTHFGVAIGGPAFWGYYPPPYYPPVVVAPAAPPVYIERDSTQTVSTTQGNWWHYCGSSKAYYPYVNACPEGWTRVAPQPANP